MFLLRAMVIYRTLLLCCVFAAGAVLAGFAAEPVAQEKPVTDRIVFLHLRREAGAVKLINATVRPGRVKPQPRAGSLTLEMVTEKGETLFSSEVKDPAVERIEYEDPASPGKIAVRNIPRENAEFTARVPFHAAARSVRFFLRGAAVRPGAVGALAERTSLGEVILPAEIFK